MSDIYEPTNNNQPIIHVTKIHSGDCQRFMSDRSSLPHVFLRKGVLKIDSEFTGEHPCRSAISKCKGNIVQVSFFDGTGPLNAQKLKLRFAKLLHVFEEL